MTSFDMDLKDPSSVFGSAEHAETVTAGRHAGVVSALAWLAFSHLPLDLQAYSRPFYEAAVGMLAMVPTDSAELTTTLNKLVEAKDWGVRAGVRMQTGRPGPMPRSGVIVDPPHFSRNFGGPSGRIPVPATYGPGQGPAYDPGNYGAGQPRPRPITDNPQA